MNEVVLDVSPVFSMIPREMRDRHKEDYEPEIVAIGPYHMIVDNGGKKTPLEPMESVKKKYLQDLCNRHEENNVDKIIVAIQMLEQKARQQYPRYSIQMTPETFVMMLVLDGCFIVEFLLKIEKAIREAMAIPEEDRKQEQIRKARTCWETGLQFTFKRRITPMLRRDFLLFENQIPFFILETILENTKHDIAGEVTILDLVLGYFYEGNIKKEMLPETKKFDSLLHLSHYCQVNQINQMSICPPDTPMDRHNRMEFLFNCSYAFELDNSNHVTSSCEWNCVIEVFLVALLSVFFIWTWPCWYRMKTNELESKMIPTATKLKEAYVRFKKKRNNPNNSSSLEVSFEDGVMEIPTMIIGQDTISEYRNLLAFEQTCEDHGDKFTSFLVIMNYLIDTADDVALLTDNNIIESTLGSEGDVAIFFNNIRSGLVFNFDSHYISKLFKKINEYRNKTFNRWRANLMRDYLNSPWKIISVLAGFALLGLTTIQTVYSIKK